MLRKAVASAVAFALVAVPAVTAPAGNTAIIVAARHAKIGSVSAESGGSLFAGDRASTAAGGVLHLRLGETSLALGAESRISVGESGVVLEQGFAQFAAPSLTGEITAAGVKIRGAGSGPVQGQVRIVNDREIQVASLSGDLLLESSSGSHRIPSRHAYRVMLPQPQGPVGSSAAAPASQMALILLGIGAVIGTIVGVVLANTGKKAVSPSIP